MWRGLLAIAVLNVVFMLAIAASQSRPMLTGPEIAANSEGRFGAAEYQARVARDKRAATNGLQVLLVLGYAPIGLGTFIFMLTFPIHAREAWRDRRRMLRMLGKGSGAIRCPLSGELTVDMKQFRLPVQLLFLGIVAVARSREVAAAPATMRRFLLGTFLRNLPLGNLMTLLLLPTFVWHYCRTFERGHSARLFDARHGLAG